MNMTKNFPLLATRRDVAPNRAIWLRIATFLLFAFGFSSVCSMLFIRAGGMAEAPGLYLYALMWSPGIAALLTRLLWDRTLKGFGWRLGNWRCLLQGYALPILYGSLLYGVIWATGLGGFPNLEVIAAFDTGSAAAAIGLFVLLRATLTFLAGSIPTALGEEIGWRGFLVPELNKVMPFTPAVFFSGIVWLLFHVPILLLADYNNGTPALFGLTCFSVGILGFTFAINWLTLRSGSLWPAVVLHASHNIFIKNVYETLTVRTEWTPYLTDEFGLGFAVVLLAVGYLYWRRRRILSSARIETTSHIEPSAAHVQAV